MKNHIDIVEGTKGIADDCFANCDSLTSVGLPSSLLFIGEDAFAYCKNLTSIDISDNDTYRNKYLWNQFRNIEDWVDDVVGDVNADGVADGLDLNTIINIVLGKDYSNYDGRADMDGDGSVDGNDINQMINILLGK